MAASDTTYRNQKVLHIIFAVTSIAMLLTVVWMFADDYYRDWKVEQRSFRDVEEEMAKRAVMANAPSEEKLDEIVKAEQAVTTAKKKVEDAKNEIAKTHPDLQSKMQKTSARAQGIKSDKDSIATFVDQAADQHPEQGLASADAQEYKKKLDQLTVDYANVTAEIEELNAEYERAAKEVNLHEYEDELKKAEAENKKLVADFDRFIKLTMQKKWSAKDNFLQLPIIDSFNSPTKIQQFTLTDLPIDYSFKYVTRYDRCMTCHMGIDRAGLDKKTLVSLTEQPDKNLITKYHTVEKILEKRKTEGGDTDLPDPHRLRPKKIDLTPGRIGQFASHPRLDLFVDGNSPHPAQNFGCSICHGGQGSATDFFQATHTPDDLTEKERWASEYGWKSNHDWDFPMLPSRFLESSCLKCHHQVTDLIREGSKVEAPTLVKGYNLVRELGCFGCHEIAGMKAGRKLGPDVRLEPDPALDTLSPQDQVRALSDPANPPGTMRKVGPSLLRVAEKTNEAWIRPWLKAPREFRPDTKMPHFYLQANNSPDVLPEEQKKFPDTEIHAIAHYLTVKSNGFLKDVETYHALKAKTILTKDEQASLASLEARSEIRSANPLVKALTIPAATDSGRGRMLFQEKGCLACHQHNATTADGKTADGKKLPALIGESNFGPDLSRVARKLGTQFDKPETGRAWLVSWLLNPAAHSSRTLMPNVQLTDVEANEIATWLLSQKAEWTPIAVAAPEVETLKAMARIYLDKVMTKSEVNRVLDNGISGERAKELAPEAYERELVGPIDEGKLKLYVGKKAIGNLGCYACHTIPGFQNAKPIGTALNDWGKKDPARLAYEDSAAFVENHFNVVKSRDDAKDPAKPAADWKSKTVSVDGKPVVMPPYEKYFADMLGHHSPTREGFLQLKLTEPRSYDYNRIRSWEDRLRMPQFKFARTKQLPNEKDDQYRTRVLKEESEGRDAVMTFVLGLVAESIPSKFVHNPAGDKLAEVKGRQVLDKFNCYGCHTVRPGVFDFEPNLDWAKLERNRDLLKEEVPYKGDDHIIPDHTAYIGRPQPRTDRMTIRGVRPQVAIEEAPDNSKAISVRLSEALHYTFEGKSRDLFASATLSIPNDSLLAAHPQYGGRFTELLSQYLQLKDKDNYAGSKANYAFAAAPPPLMSEGERVQPEWFYRFLLNPYPIRPLTVLRMPKFNMSPDDAQALVNYFTAVSKTNNPGIGLVYPYVSLPVRTGEGPERHAPKYIEQLKKDGKLDEWKKGLQPALERVVQTQLFAAKQRAEMAEERLKLAKNDTEKAEADKLKQDAAVEVKRLTEKATKKDYADLLKDWEQKDAYVLDASRLVTAPNAICITCHNVGEQMGKENKGPNLGLASERLRPDWTARWLNNPERFLPYTSVMPNNFNAQKRDWQDLFMGSSEEQIRATRDFLMLYPELKDRPLIRERPILGTAAPASGEKK